MRALLVVALSAASAAAQAESAFRVFAPCGDHMVLPAQAAVPLRGAAPPGAEVVVEGSWGAVARERADAAGRFALRLATPPPGGPFELTFACGEQRVRLTDVLVGQVWLCAGQSNMEMPVGDRGGWRLGVHDWQREVAAADLPQLRFFTVAGETRGQPAETVAGEWQVVSPATAAACSATAFFFGRDLLQAGHGPVGLVVAAWGGTVAEAWTPAAALADFPEFAAELREVQSPPVPEARSAALAAFWAAVPTAPDPAAAWRDAAVPERWSQGELRDFDGVAFYRRRVAVPVAWRGQDLQLDLGPLDDMDTVWADGQRLGGHEDEGHWSEPRRYAVPAALAADGELELVVRVLDTQGEGGFGGEAEAVALRLAAAAAAPLPLAGPWQAARGPALGDLPRFPPRGGRGPNRPSVLWNGMVAPLLPWPFAGAIWYQGESNRGRAAQYERLFPTLIEAWRAANGGALPFYFVQIAPFRYGGDHGQTGDLRAAQAAALRLPATGMVVTLDCGDPDDIHPRDKRTVGVRLAHLVRRDRHGETLPAGGPVLQAATRDGAAVRLAFAATGGLWCTAGVEEFEVAGADGVFHAATASWCGGAVLAVQAAAVREPRAVRYAWRAAPNAQVRDGIGWPLAPFAVAVP